jgi:inosine-uridine nucleoside N-ribohydrolase
VVTKVIFDTDPGVDDTAALLFIHAAPELDLVGITTVFGNAHIETTTRNALYLAERFNIPCPVAQGAGQALKRRYEGPPVLIHGVDGLGDVGVPETISRTADPRPAHRFIIDMVKAHPGEITLIAVGRITNLAHALAEAPEIAGLVKQVVIMGGAFGQNGHGGNVTPAAEANIIGDPEAADIVLGAPWPVVVVGLDVTKETFMAPEGLARLVREAGDAGCFIAQTSELYKQFHIDRHGLDGLFMHDSCAVAYVLAPELFTTRSGTMRVVTEGIAVGQTIQKPDSVNFAPGAWDGLPSQLACIGIDHEAVLELFHQKLARLGN